MTADEMRVFRRSNGKVVVTYRTNERTPFTYVGINERDILYVPVHKAGDMDDGGPHSTLTVVVRHNYSANVYTHWQSMFGNGIYRDVSQGTPFGTYIPNYEATRDRGPNYHYEAAYPESSQGTYYSGWTPTASGVRGTMYISKWNSTQQTRYWIHSHLVSVTLSGDYYSKVYTQWTTGLVQSYRNPTEYPLLADPASSEAEWRLGGGYYDCSSMEGGEQELPGDFVITTVWHLPNDLTLLMNKATGNWLNWGYSPELLCTDNPTLVSATFS